MNTINKSKSARMTTDQILSTTVQGWTACLEDMSGCIVWSHPSTDILIYGTPDWDHEGQTPFAIIWANSDDYFDIGTVVTAQYMHKLKSAITLVNKMNETK